MNYSNQIKNRMNRIPQLLAMVAMLVIGAFSGAHANIMQLSESGTGQALLFPYYSARNGTTTFLSLVNTTAQGKAVRLNFREARSGFVIHRLNLYLSAKDVWTSVIVSDAEGASLATLDKSCTSPPIIAAGIPFSAAAYQTQVNESRDRTREGFVEVIEMASIPNRTNTGKAITHSAGVPACNQNVRDPAYEPPATDLTPPSGGLTGTLTLLSITQGMLASSAAVAIENFWASGTGAPAPRVYAANDTAPDLTSGGNVWARISAVSLEAPAVLTSQSLSSRPDTYIARFASAIDAVSALLTKSSLSTEYAHTSDNVIATTLIVTFPTKPYYIRTPNLGMFQSPWNSDTAQSCDSFLYSTNDREEYAPIIGDGSMGEPPPRFPQMCFVANLLRSGGGSGQPAADATYLGSLIAIEVWGIQNQGAEVLTAGKEGGWAELSWVKSTAALDTREATIYRTDAGKLVATSTNIRLIGLPAIGFTLSQSGYKTGSPQQNFADATPMRSMLAATPVP